MKTITPCKLILGLLWRKERQILMRTQERNYFYNRVYDANNDCTTFILKGRENQVPPDSFK